jgi:hypothetical protein
METILAATSIGIFLIFIFTIALASFLGLFLMGILVGWLGKEEIFKMNYDNLHPEFFDEHGNLISDKIISLRFEDTNDDTDTTEDIEED